MISKYDEMVVMMMMMMMNKRNCLKVVGESFDISRQVIWRATESGNISKQRAEKTLVDYDKSMDYLGFMLHDMLTGITAQWVQDIRDDGTVVIGHQAQGVLLKIPWKDIHELSQAIKTFDQKQRDEAEEEKIKDDDDDH